MSLPVILLLVAGLLTVISLVQRLAARLSLPGSILFAVVGIAIGTIATLVLHGNLGGGFGEVARVFVDVPVSSGTFIYVFLPALLFQSSLTVDVRRLIEDAAPILLLAVIAVLVATFVIGLALFPIAGVSLVACLLLGAMVATTDSVAVIAIFRDVGAPARLTRLVEGESLLNDAAAIVLFTVLLNLQLGGAGTSAAAAIGSFLFAFVGGVAAGYLGARLVVAMLSWLQDLRLAQVTLTLALPYLVYIIGERGLGVSGVVAAVTAGLVMSAIGPPRIAPRDWQFLNDVWEQLGYWASSLIFVLAALLVPRLLGDFTLHDSLVIAVQILAALAARALVLFVFLPVVTALKLTRRVGIRYNLVILWGGLRGAVTLALALAITEDARIPHDVQRFIAVQATGLTLFTLLVSGLTLRPLIRWLGLDHLSAFDQALRAHVLALSRGRVADAVRSIGQRYRFTPQLIETVAGAYQPPPSRALPAGPVTTFTAVASPEDQLRLALVALTQREREIVMEHFDARTISGRAVQEILHDLARLADRTRGRGQAGYETVAAELAGFGRGFRFAHFLHRRFAIDGPLVDRLADRFERLLTTRIVLDELAPFIDEALVPLVGAGLAPNLHGHLEARRRLTSAALEALALQYPRYAALLEQRFLQRVGLRHEAREYAALFSERFIGPELYATLQKDVQAARAATDVRPRLDLGLETRALLARVPLFEALAQDQLDATARMLRPRLAVPGERIVHAGDVGDTMFFIATGEVVVHAPGDDVTLEAGQFFGEMALLQDQPRGADVVATTYCQLLVLSRADLNVLRRSNRAIRQSIDRAAAKRERENRPKVTGPWPR
ncbi:MAG TPA: cation:proton antiporter [Vicinamibacterales bacterium]|nr:cation:proton antiporter [Vicinamibacterales bacterium]